MSLQRVRLADAFVPAPKATAQTLLDRKRAREPITALTAYDYPTARLVDEAGIDMVLVGDSVGMAVLGHENTLSLTVDEMLHHAKAARRGIQRAFLVVDMPYMAAITSAAKGRCVMRSASSRKQARKP